MNPGSRWLFGLLLTTACAAPAAGCAKTRPAFDAARAYTSLTRQTQFGPRIPGTAAHQACLEWMKAELGERGDSMIVQEFRGAVLGSDSVEMSNLIVRFRPTATHRILIGAHWDTRSFADNDPDSSNHRKPFDGANDGGSGVAILMELARALDSIPPPIGVDLAFFDGEDMGEDGDLPGNWCQGARFLASHLTSRYDWGAVLDMVGGSDLKIPFEGYSERLAPDVVDRIWKAAETLGETSFQRVRGGDIYDDHMAFLMRGIKVVDLIDFDYKWWHTLNDTADKCSAASLGAVGRVLLAVIYE